MGARHAAADRRRSLTGRHRWQAMLDAYEASRTSSEYRPAGKSFMAPSLPRAFRSGARSRRRGYAVPVGASAHRTDRRERRSYFVAGTDTGVGKTRITAALLAAGRAAEPVRRRHEACGLGS
jgi:hypothetical protein